VITIETAVFLHENRIGTGRHRRAGENAHCFAGLELTRPGMPGSDAIDNDKTPLAFAIKVFRANRVTVDRGIIKRR
jgi:hypothetical protein